jgi:hypothetical protein
VVEVALSGNLGFVPLDEVLRLLMRSDQRGSVEVRGEDVRGRIFVGKKGIALATTAEDRDLHKHLVNSGYVDDAFLRKVVTGASTFSDLHDRESVIIDLLREITIESLYHLGTKGSSFEVTEGAVTPYASPRPFELESALDDSRRRADEWAAVLETISDLDTTIRMNREAGDQDEINLNREAWRLLCEIGNGASVAAIAERLGTTNFWIAKVAADMAERQLIEFNDGWSEQTAPEPVQAPSYAQPAAPADSWWVEPQDERQDELGALTEDEPASDAEPVMETADVATVFEQAADQTDAPEADDSKESRFGHFAWPARPADAFAAEDEAGTAHEQTETVAEGTEVDSESEQGVEEDTEAFLEKVFSQLDGNGNGNGTGKVDVEEEGHGLLRRRRMGSVLKEIDED